MAHLNIRTQTAKSSWLDGKLFWAILIACGFVILMAAGNVKKAQTDSFQADQTRQSDQTRKIADIEQKAAMLIKGSDEYDRFKQPFAVATANLLQSGRCTERDFKDAAGWTRSVNANKTTYFVYCGEFKLENRIYLNAATGEIYQ